MGFQVLLSEICSHQVLVFQGMALPAPPAQFAEENSGATPHETFALTLTPLRVVGLATQTQNTAFLNARDLNASPGPIAVRVLNARVVPCKTLNRNLFFLGNEKSAPKFFRLKFFHGRPHGMSVAKCLFFEHLEGLTEVFGRMSAGISGQKLPLWAEFSFLTFGTSCLNRAF